VLISPDGPLHAVPFGALPGRTPERYLIEEVAIARVSVPAMLPELLGERDPAGEGLLLVGEVDYGRPVDGHGAMTYPPLAASGAEIAAIRESFQHGFDGAEPRQLAGEQASEEAFRDAAPGRRWIHVATHGFFAPPAIRRALAPTGGDDERRLGLGRAGVEAVHPGLLSGLVLAGANRSRSDEEHDGVLTALEVAGLDLTGVEMVVLSACETGLGRVADGEGVLGLQRAFQTAGARTTVTSLWKVPDDATRRLMQSFYENLWIRGMGKLEALRRAQLTVLRQPGREGAVRGVRIPRRSDAGTPDAPPPRSWGGFVLSGDWR
jgi:CHAT domain-containing protein